MRMPLGRGQTDPVLGQDVLGYRIERLIGAGGMGSVYEGVHPKIGQRVAIKVLSPEVSRDEEAVRRFVHEARAASRVEHPSLVKIFNHGQLADETAYIMMEYVPGESLRDRLLRLAQQGERISVSEAVQFAQQIAAVLSAVHQKGIVHRDLKPANLIITPDSMVPGGERIKVVDFGIAKFDSGTETEVGQTTVGKFLGTALYASPEVCQMAGEVSAKSDVYALGVILYEMLAGKPPFHAPQPGMVIGMHLFKEPPPLSQAAPQTPESLCDLIHLLLDKSPERRPSMQTVAERLSALELGSATLPPRVQRSHGVVIVGTAALLGLAVPTGVVLWRQSHSPVRVLPLQDSPSSKSSLSSIGTKPPSPIAVPVSPTASTTPPLAAGNPSNQRKPERGDAKPIPAARSTPGQQVKKKEAAPVKPIAPPTKTTTSPGEQAPLKSPAPIKAPAPTRKDRYNDDDEAIHG